MLQIIQILQILWFLTTIVKKKHNLRQFNLLNVTPCTEAPSNIQHSELRARVYVRDKAKRVKAYKSEAFPKKEQKICFQGSAEYRRVDPTVWNHNTLPLPINLDPNPLSQFINIIQCILVLSHTCQQTNWIHDPKDNPFHNCPAHHQFEVNLLSCRLSVSEVELTIMTQKTYY